MCRRGAVGTRRLIKALGHDRVSVVPRLTEATFVAKIRDERPELLVSWFWTKRIPEPLLRVAPLGTVGVHPSLLPRHRGPDPYFWTILRGDAEAGVTAHRLERDYDTGAILGQKRIPVDPTWTAWTLAKRLDRPSLALLRHIVREFSLGRPPEERAQDPAWVTEAPSPSEDALRLDVRKAPAASLERLVRAASPWPGAVMEIESELIVVTRAAVAPAPPALAPGEAATVNGRAVVRAADTGLAILAGRIVSDDDGEGELDEAGMAALVARLSRDAALA